MAELVQPRMALKIPQPPLLGTLGEQHYSRLDLTASWELERVTYVDVPNALIDIIRASTGAELGSLTTNVLVPLLVLKVPDGAGEETGGDEVQEAGGGDEEELELGGGTTPSGVVSDRSTSCLGTCVTYLYKR